MGETFDRVLLLLAWRLPRLSALRPSVPYPASTSARPPCGPPDRREHVGRPGGPLPAGCSPAAGSGGRLPPLTSGLAPAEGRMATGAPRLLGEGPPPPLPCPAPPPRPSEIQPARLPQRPSEGVLRRGRPGAAAGRVGSGSPAAPPDPRALRARRPRRPSRAFSGLPATRPRTLTRRPPAGRQAGSQAGGRAGPSEPVCVRASEREGRSTSTGRPPARRRRRSVRPSVRPSVSSAMPRPARPGPPAPDPRTPAQAVVGVVPVMGAATWLILPVAYACLKD